MDILLLSDVLKENKKIRNRIWEMLCEADEEFYPPLSVRDSDNVIFLDKQELVPNGKPYVFFEEVMNQFIIVAIEEDNVIGFLSFEKNYINEDLLNNDFKATWYVNALIVDPKHRRKGIANKLYGFLEKIAVGNTPDIFTRTWISNNSHIELVLQRGYQLVITLLNHRGKDKHTVYYRMLIEDQ